MKTIHVATTLHRGIRRIKVVFAYDSGIITSIKSIEGCRWSSTLGCWHLPYNDNSLESLYRMQQELTLNIPEIENLKNERRSRYFDRELSQDKLDLVRSFGHYMKVLRYSERTIQTYVEAIRTFLSYFRDRKVEVITADDVRDFNFTYVIGNNFSASYQNQIISSIKLFFGNILKKEIDITEIQRPITGRSLPGVFSVEEVELLLNRTENIKHRAMLSLIYACGLRRSELLNVKIDAIDSKRKLLIIRGGKGKKDRIVPLPDSLISLLREYYRQYRPVSWLFEGNEKGRPYSEASLREVFEAAKKRAKITRKMTLHCLRHSYATHLLENGVDLRYIQELLGHSSSKTTEIYTHVTRKSIEKIKSPFDSLNLV